MLTELEVKYVKCLEERIEELTTRLAVEEKRTAPGMSAEDIIVKYIAHNLQFNAGDKVPAPYRWNDVKCEEKSARSAMVVNGIRSGRISIDQKYIDMVIEAMKKIKIA